MKIKHLHFSTLLCLLIVFQSCKKENETILLKQQVSIHPFTNNMELDKTNDLSDDIQSSNEFGANSISTGAFCFCDICLNSRTSKSQF